VKTSRIKNNYPVIEIIETVPEPKSRKGKNVKKKKFLDLYGTKPYRFGRGG